MQNRLCSTNKKCQTMATVLIAVPDLKMFPILKNGQILTNGSKINMAGGFPKEISLTLESFIFYSRARGFSRRVCKVLTVHIFEALCVQIMKMPASGI